MLTRQAIGQQAEDQACAHLQAQGLRLLQRNYRVARGPRAHGGEIDLVMLDPEGTLVFVEVRARQHAAWGGAAGSITATKRQRLRFAAACYLRRYTSPPPCRFDVVLLQAGVLQWWPAAFDAG